MNKKINLPNRLTLARIALIPIFVCIGSIENIYTQVGAALVFGIACVTDYLDGDIARKRNLVTNFGKFADPIADKLLVMSAYVLFVAQARMPAWVCISFLAREFTVSGFRLVASTAGHVLAAGKLGKVKTVTQMIAVFMIMLLVPIKSEPLLGETGHIIANIAMYIALFMTMWSGVDYIWKNREFIKDM